MRTQNSHGRYIALAWHICNLYKLGDLYACQLVPAKWHDGMMRGARSECC